MSSEKRSIKELPSDLLLLAALLVTSSGVYALGMRSDYVTAIGWFVAGIFFYLRSRQLVPIVNRLVRLGFWVVGLGLLVAIWWPTLR